jgi:hypothetical protein
LAGILDFRNPHRVRLAERPRIAGLIEADVEVGMKDHGYDRLAVKRHGGLVVVAVVFQK